MDDKNNMTEIDVKEIFYLLIHKSWIIFIFLIAGAASILAASRYLIQPVYTSTAKVYVINKEEDKSSFTLSDLQSGAQLTQDYMIVVQSRPVMEQVINEMNLSLTSDALKDLITVTSPENTRILEISVRNHDPAIAKRIVDSITEVSAERMVSIMGLEKVNIMEYGNLPVYPSSPNITSNTMLGGAVGALLAVLFIVLIHLTNDSIRTSEDIEKYLGITALGLLPIDDKPKNTSIKYKTKFKFLRKKRISSVA